MRWRWDQGRLAYFRYENILSMAKVLCSLDGISLNVQEDLLRSPFERGTGLPFAPSHYKVWRNYARVFQCTMLATSVDNKLIVSELCQNLAGEPPFSSDEYLNFVFSHFQYPFPAFKDYNTIQKPTFPFVAIVKFLMSRKGVPVTLDDIFSFVIGNECTGLESVEEYRLLRETSRTPNGDELRQVREMLAFMSQSSFIRWFDSQLYIDTDDYEAVLSTLIPFVLNERSGDPARDFLNITSLSNSVMPLSFDIDLKDRHVSEIYLKEGGRKFVSHQKIERSPLLRKWYFKLHPTIECDACGILPEHKYPWLEDRNILELHHVLPLSATLNVSRTTTAMEDLRPLCPNCHRSIHIFYKLKLEELNIQDFTSKQMAMDVYESAKRSVV